jgi:hypothetical protein
LQFADAYWNPIPNPHSHHGLLQRAEYIMSSGPHLSPEERKREIPPTIVYQTELLTMRSAKTPGRIMDARPCASLHVTSSLLLYSATLQRRCQRAYGWDAALVNRVFVSYMQFLTLKVLLKDFDAEYLSPSFLVDQMWHQHLLDNRHYEQFCHYVCPDGRQIYHNPEGGDDIVAQQRRMVRTQSALKKRFEGAIDDIIWGFDIVGASGTAMQLGIKKHKYSSGASTRAALGDDHSSLASSSCPDDDAKPSVTLKVVNQMGEEHWYKVLRTSPMQHMFVTHSQKFGLKLSDLVFLREGQRIKPGDTPINLKLVEGCIIDCSIIPQLLTVNMRSLTGYARTYQMSQTSSFQGIFSRFGGGVKAEGRRTIWNGKEIYEFQTPAECGMVVGDNVTIHFILKLAGC